MNDLRALIDSYLDELSQYSARLVQMQLTLQGQIADLCNEFSGADRGEVQDFIDCMVRARESYSNAGDIIWRAKEKLEEYSSLL